jgi:hypothetical protein
MIYPLPQTREVGQIRGHPWKGTQSENIEEIKKFSSHSTTTIRYLIGNIIYLAYVYIKLSKVLLSALRPGFSSNNQIAYSFVYKRFCVRCIFSLHDVILSQ